MSVCLFVNRITQKLLDQTWWNLVGRYIIVIRRSSSILGAIGSKSRSREVKTGLVQLTRQKLSTSLPHLHKVNNLFTQNRYGKADAKLRYLLLESINLNNLNGTFKTKDNTYSHLLRFLIRWWLWLWKLRRKRKIVFLFFAWKNYVIFHIYWDFS